MSDKSELNLSRRDFGRCCAGAAALLLVGRAARAADLPLVDEAGSQAQAVGYKHDASKVDAAKFPAYAAGNSCANCQLFQGAGAATGPCPLFAGSAVSATGWCSAWVKKA